MSSILCLGEALVDFVADASGVTLAECPGFRKAAGGAVANVAVALARLGADAAFLGKVGEDPFGHFLERTFAGAGVNTEFMRFDPQARTGLAFVSLTAEGERDFVFFRNPSADMRYRPDELPIEALAACRLYHFGSISLIDEPVHATTLTARWMAREGGALISFDPNLRAPLWPDLYSARNEIMTALPLADIVKLSDEEGDFLFGPGEPEGHAARVLELGPRLVAVTSGAGGSYLATSEARAVVPGFRVNVADTTGAGDGFMAGLLCGVLQLGSPATLDSGSLYRLGQYANAVGALTCTEKGAIPALPTREAVERFLHDAAA